MRGLLDKRLVYVTGKGGVGKSTVAAALGLVAARQGRRTMLAEVAAQDRVSRTFGRDAAGFGEEEIATGLFHISIDPQHALEEYLRLQMPARPMADLLTSSRMFQYFAAATPGMRELLTMGKIWELAQLERRTRGASPYDLVVVDAPATGHGLALLAAPGTFADVARVGPVARQARIIERTIRDADQVAVVAVAQAEEMPVIEALALRDALRERIGHGPEAAIVNAVQADRFSERQAATIGRALDTAGTPVARAALRAALSQHARARRQREQVDRLCDGLDLEPVLLPFVPSNDGERAVFETLADHLAEHVEAAA